MKFKGAFITDPLYLDNFVYARGDESFDIAPNVEAAAKYQEWIDNGYFTQDFNGIGYDDAFQLFSNGQGAMFLTGTWISGDLSAGPNADKMGFFLFPGPTEGGFKPIVAGTSTGYTIRKDSPNTDLAAEYIDWMMSDRAMELWIGAGLVPVVEVDPAVLEEGTLYADMVNAWESVLATNSAGHYIDWATPTFYDTITASLQELGGFQITPQEFTQKVEADYDAWLTEKGLR